MLLRLLYYNVLVTEWIKRLTFFQIQSTQKMTFWDMIHHQFLPTQECQHTPTVFALSSWIFYILLFWWSWSNVSAVVIFDNSIFWIKSCIVQKAQVLHSQWEIGIFTNMVDQMSIMHGWREINARLYGISSLTWFSIYAICYRWSTYVSCYSFTLN